MIRNIPLYKGTDAPFQIKLWQDEAKTIPITLYTYTDSSSIVHEGVLDLIVYIYTDKQTILKYSLNNKGGYNRLIRVSNFECKGWIEGKDNVLLTPGRITLEVQYATLSTEISTNRYKRAGIGTIYILVDDEIKAEV